MLRIPQWRRLGIYFAFTLACVSAFQDADTFCIRGHDSILDPVMDHLHEMAGAVRSAMQVTLFGRSAKFVAAGGARRLATARRQRGTSGIETLNYLCVAANHHAITTFQAPDAAAGSDIDIVNT